VGAALAVAAVDAVVVAAAACDYIQNTVDCKKVNFLKRDERNGQTGCRNVPCFKFKAGRIVQEDEGKASCKERL
jgi:hypothetical protein